MTDGFSCRTQVSDLCDVGGQHLAQILQAALREAGTIT